MWVATAVTVASLTANAVMGNQAEIKGRADALEDRKRKNAAEIFSSTEGEGIGSLGTVSLEVDDVVDKELIK